MLDFFLSWEGNPNFPQSSLDTFCPPNPECAPNLCKRCRFQARLSQPPLLPKNSRFEVSKLVRRPDKFRRCRVMSVGLGRPSPVGLGWARPSPLGWAEPVQVRWVGWGRPSSMGQGLSGPEMFLKSKLQIYLSYNIISLVVYYIYCMWVCADNNIM